MTFLFWSSHFGQEIGHLGSDDFFFFLVFASLHFTVVGKNLRKRAGVSSLLNHPPPNLEKWQKNGQFCRIIPPNTQHRFASLAPGYILGKEMLLTNLSAPSASHTFNLNKTWLQWRWKFF